MERLKNERQVLETTAAKLGDWRLEGATVYVNPTNGLGDEVCPRTKDGKTVGKMSCNGPYRSAADEFKI